MDNYFKSIFKKLPENQPIILNTKIDNIAPWKNSIVEFLKKKNEHLTNMFKISSSFLAGTLFIGHLNLFGLIAALVCFSCFLFFMWDIHHKGIFFKKTHLKHIQIVESKKQLFDSLKKEISDIKTQKEILEKINFFIEKERSLETKNSLGNLKNFFLHELAEKNHEMATRYLLQFFSKCSYISIVANFYEDSLDFEKTKESRISLKKTEEKFLDLL